MSNYPGNAATTNSTLAMKVPLSFRFHDYERNIHKRSSRRDGNRVAYLLEVAIPCQLSGAFDLFLFFVLIVGRTSSFVGGKKKSSKKRRKLNTF